jgi:hypothetical protein
MNYKIESWRPVFPFSGVLTVDSGMLVLTLREIMLQHARIPEAVFRSERGGMRLQQDGRAQDDR